jgi:hypothetical protein
MISEIKAKLAYLFVYITSLIMDNHFNCIVRSCYRLDVEHALQERKHMKNLTPTYYYDFNIGESYKYQVFTPDYSSPILLEMFIDYTAFLPVS